MKDTIFRSGREVDKFKFDEKVAAVFDDMLSRSVPFYAEIQKIIADLSRDHYREGSRIYDLGCSTGTTMIHLCQKIDTPGLTIIGIDSSEPVIERAQKKVEGYALTDRIELVCGDIMDIEISRASVVIMNYTLQFIPPESRLLLLKRIYEGLTEGGVLLLSEKVLEVDDVMSDRFIEKYYDFKRSMGYSALEISKKREALEEVLIPLTVDAELQLLESAGFDQCAIFFKWFNFASFMAVKGASDQRDTGHGDSQGVE